MPDYSASIESASSGTAWLWPPQGHYPAIASIKVAIKHDPRDQVKLLLNNEGIDPIYFDGLVRKSDNAVAISIWRGIHLKEGDNQLEAVLVDASGKETGRLQKTIHYSGPPVKAMLVPERSRLIANGRNPNVLAVRFVDKDGHPAREGVLGEYRLDPPYVSQQRADELQQSPLTAPATDRLKFQIKEDGVALIELTPTTQTGEAGPSLSSRGWHPGGPDLAQARSPGLGPDRPCRGYGGIQCRQRQYGDPCRLGR